MNNLKLYNLTIPQKAIYLAEQYSSGTSLNSIGGNLIIEENVNLDLLEKALNIFVKNNDALRIRIHMENGTPMQYISPYEPFYLKRVFLKEKSDLEGLTSEIINAPFTFLDSTLFYFSLFKFEDGSGGFNVSLHHIISDAWSMSLLVDSVLKIYSNLLNNTPINEDVNYSYLDFIKNEQDYFNTSRFKKDKEFWNSFFSTEPQHILISQKKEKRITTTAKRKSFVLNKELYERINSLCKKNNCSLYSFFMAIYSLYLARLNNTNFSTIGTPILNRVNIKEKSTCGIFCGTQPFCLNINYAMSFSDFLKDVTCNQIKFFRHQKYPYSTLLEDLKKQYNISYNLYDLAFSYQNARTNNAISDIKIHTNWFFNNNCSDSLQIHFYDLDDTGIINIYYDYKISKFSQQEIEVLHSRIINMAIQVLDNSSILLEDISIIDDSEKQFIDNISGNIKIGHPRNIGIHDLISAKAKEYPNNTAITFNNSHISYKDLDIYSTKIANNLISNGIRKGDTVAVLLQHKDINLIATLLGILKTGSAFLAIYSGYPKERIEYILQDSNSKILVTEDYFDNLKLDFNKLYLTNLKDFKENLVFPKVDPDDNAYIIYTSGSTGKPKGTVQSHNNIINFVYSLNYYFDNTILPNDNFLSVTNICFDVSMAEIFTALAFGANLHLYKDLNNSSISNLAEYIYANNITFSYFPPSMLHSIYEELDKYPKLALNKILVGVEPIKACTLANFYKLNPDIKIINGYGPSETTICCTMYKFKNDLPADTIVPIGTPVGNSKILILDKLKKSVPIGNIGEIYVQGECVGNGYLNNPEKTKLSFNLQNKLYKTGDFAKWLPDGTIMFVGRNDNQVKYRGYRIDLGEIESTIKNISGIKNCTVIFNNEDSANPTLIAFVIMDSSKIDQETFRNNLVRKLPHYMVPNQFEFLTDFPLNTNGKIDRKKLLSFAQDKDNEIYEPPKNELEKTLCSIWEKVLGKDTVGIKDNFFSLGGDSLDSIKVSVEALEYGINLSAQDFYRYPTIKLLEKYAISTKDINIENNDSYKYEGFTIEKPEPISLNGDILLTGATGFLGSHLLYELLKKTPYTVYCLVRGNSLKNATSRLKERLNYYFKDGLNSYFGNRIFVINGDFTKEHLGLSYKLYNSLKQNIKYIINSAATVKHLGNYSNFEKTNVLSVKNLIDVCKDIKNCHLVHISTLSIAGTEDPKGEFSFTEKDLFINQDVGDNIYIKTKFEAERLLLAEQKNGLPITIFRLGNITWRNSDGIFQYDLDENLFFNFIKLILKTKQVPEELKNKTFNISPVDECANLIISILQNNNKYNVYHIYNENELTLEEIINLLNNLNFNIKFTSESSLKDLKYISKEEVNLSSYLQKLLTNKQTASNIKVSSPYTNQLLKQLNFNWSNINTNYFKHGLEENLK
ncbi:MAG: amino acid adenylation domain-containing protein [Clostridium sp.]|nr:amino acid adenylation domain-containing protein [Clostridium sp.]